MGVWRVRALIRAPLPQVWAFLIEPSNLHVWGPATRPVTGLDRPFQVGDRLTLYRLDFVRTQRQILRVDQVVPCQMLRFRDLSPGATTMNVTATLSLTETADGEATCIEETIAYSLGRGRVLQWLDRRVIVPLFQPVVRYKGTQAFRRVQASLAKAHAERILESAQEEHKGAAAESEPP